MRYERKYRIESFSPEIVRQVVLSHPFGFRKAFPDRQINNIYFDTANTVAYQENVDGIADRRKFRVRWYGTDIFKIENPKLEIKIKSNELGRKESYPVQAFSLNNLQALSKEVSRYSLLRLELQPALINSYQRSYYTTANGDFRMTIDWKLQYFSPMYSLGFTRYNIMDEATILELKYDESKANRADEVLQYIPFRHTKSSKYVTGMNLTVH